MENTSGHGNFAVVPSNIKKWNWGAFWLTWIWGIFHNTYISFLVFLPIANLIMPFYLGAKGNELAWANKCWSDEEELLRTEKKWAIAGWIVVIFLLILWVTSVVINIDVSKNNKEITNNLTDQVIELIQNDKNATEILGEDINIIVTPNIFNFGTENKQIIYLHMLVEGVDGNYWVEADINEDGAINKIEISKESQSDNNQPVYTIIVDK